MTSPKLVIIHGATASPSSFNYLLSCTDFESVITINYSSENSFDHNLRSMRTRIPTKLPCFIVAHSLGGIYAVHLARTHNILGAVTISTPYGGSEISTLMSWVMPKTQLYKDIHPYSAAILQSKKIPITVPWTQIVTTKGHNLWHTVPHDGVVTVNSMMCRTDMQHVHLHYNHYEIMQSPELVDIVLNCYNSTR